jgi:L-Lysine epsilon oxidase N-terminal
VAIYKIHPGIGIARLGNSDTDFYLAPETPAGLPQACDASGNPLYQADGVTPVLVTNFKDAEGRIKRQAARFQVFVYDDESPEGRPLKIGEKIEGGGNNGTLVDIQWQVYVANKKACWYEFDTTQGEHGYPDNYPRRNADVTDRSRLIIDPGPRVVNGKTNAALRSTAPARGATPPRSRPKN